MSDHVHMMISIPSKYAVSQLRPSHNLRAKELHQIPLRTNPDQYGYELKAESENKRVVTIQMQGNKNALLPPERRDLGENYPGKFAWGYLGSGPRFLAISLLAHHFGHDNFGPFEINALLVNCISKLPSHHFIGPYFFTSKLIETYLREPVDFH